MSLVRSSLAVGVRLAAVATLLGSVACGDPSAPVNRGAVIAIEVDSSGGPISRTVVVRTDEPAPVEVTYGAPGTPVLTIAADSFATVHRLVLPRLRAEHVYRLEAGVARGTSAPLEMAFGTGPLPPAIAAIDFTVTGTPTLPVALIEVAGGRQFTGLLMVEDALVVGYIPIAGSLFGMSQRRDGSLVLLDGDLGIGIHRADGSLLHRLPQAQPAGPMQYGRIHHDVVATPHNTILFIANDTRTIDAESVVGEALWEWNPETGAVTKRWSAFDHLDWRTERGSRSVAGNWLHGNGIAYGPRGNVVMSLRNANLVISIAPDFSRLEWSVGGVNGTLAVAAADRFYGQHYVTEPAPNRLLVYDNGFDRPSGTFTRAIEYSIDAGRRTATRVWEYRHTPDIFASLVGSTRRLPNGNTVVLFGMLAGQNNSTGPLTTLEVTPGGGITWRLDAGTELTRLYRVTPVASVAGERAGAFTAR